jgi:hypothetical protein
MVMDYINTQKEEDWLNLIYLPKKAPYLNPNERKVNQQIKSNICANADNQKAEGSTIHTAQYKRCKGSTLEEKKARRKVLCYRFYATN